MGVHERHAIAQRDRVRSDRLGSGIARKSTGGNEHCLANIVPDLDGSQLSHLLDADRISPVLHFNYGGNTVAFGKNKQVEATVSRRSRQFES
jgi:hypothetical protein